MRRAHYLKKNAKVELPQHMLFVDTETRGTQIDETTSHQTLWFGWYCYSRRRTGANDNGNKDVWRRFGDAHSFWTEAVSYAYNKTRLWVFAHNWNFDAGILNVSRILPAMGWNLSTYINDKPPFILEFRSKGRTIRLIDSLNYFAGSLESIGESIGIAKLPMPKPNANQREWDAYCKRDVEVLRDAVLGFRSFVDEHQLGNFQQTLASQAMTAFRHRFMTHKILIHNEEHNIRIEREGYFGGRSECFFLGERNEPLYYLDVNSMYPSVMRSERFPSVIWRGRSNVTIPEALEYREGNSVMVQVKVQTNEPVYPSRIDHRLCFPIGRFVTVLSTPEFDYAIARGHIESVERIVIYEQEKLFTSYVDTLYELRQKYKLENNDTYQHMCKIMLNSLYGKFGQNGSKWYDVGPISEQFDGIVYEQDPDTGDVRKLRQRMDMLQEYKRMGESANSFPAIAAHVTAFGRVQLWDLIMKAGRENVFYCDTDSLITNEAGKTRLIPYMDTTAIGKLKVEDTGHMATFWGPKDYRFGQVDKHKGIKKNAKQLAINRWEQDRFYSWDYLISQKRDGYIPIERVQKTLHRVYKKGTPTESGWVRPLVLSEW
tara:strand:+ start:965 stop:2764 length:1800 start_codon:yes stop_codon:yes gene_type:complete